MHNPVINEEHCMLLLKDMSMDYEFFLMMILYRYHPTKIVIATEENMIRKSEV